MTLRQLLTAATTLALSVATGPSSAQPGQSAWRAPVEARPMLTVRVSTTGARAFGSGIPGGMEVVRGDYLGFAFTPGFPEPGSLCLNSLTMGVARSNLQSGLVSWFVESRLVDMAKDEATIDLRWTRSVNEPGLTPSQPLTVEQRLVLRNGSHGVLDLLRATTTPAADGCGSLALEYDFRFEGARALDNAAITYDVWLVQQDSEGAAQVARVSATAKQDDEAHYYFAPMNYQRDGTRAQSHPAVRVTVSGTVRGRVRTDGDIDLTVDAGRGYYSLDQHGDGHAASWNHGRTLITVKPGETVETVIDPPSGDHALSGVGKLANAFGGHRTAIRITARRLW
jgi:hypothetical protein